MARITVPPLAIQPNVTSTQSSATKTGTISRPSYQVHDLAFTFDGRVLPDLLVNGHLNSHGVLTARLREQRDFREVLLAHASQQTPTAQIFRNPQRWSKEELEQPGATTMSYVVVGFISWPAKSLSESMKTVSDFIGGSSSMNSHLKEIASLLVVAAIPSWSVQTLFLYVLLEPQDGLCTPYIINFEDCQQVFWRWPFCAKSMSGLGSQKREEVIKEILVVILALQQQGIGNGGSRKPLGQPYGDNFQGGPDLGLADSSNLDNKREEIRAREEGLIVREAALAASEKKLEESRLAQEEKMEQDRLALEKRQSDLKTTEKKVEEDKKKLKKGERKLKVRREELADSLATVSNALRHGGEVIVKKSKFENSESVKQEDKYGFPDIMMNNPAGSKRGSDHAEGEGEHASKRLRQSSAASPKNATVAPPSEPLV